MTLCHIKVLIQVAVWAKKNCSTVINLRGSHIFLNFNAHRQRHNFFGHYIVKRLAGKNDKYQLFRGSNRAPLLMMLY